MKSTKSRKPVIAQSMGAAAGILKVEKRVLQDAAKRGAPGFLSSGRIDVEKLRPWLEANQQPKVQPPTPPTPEELEELRTLESSLHSAIDEEIAARRMLQAARQAADVASLPSLAHTYAIAQRARLASEKAVREEQTKRGELISLDDHKIQCNRLVIPQITLLRGLPRVLALKVAPGDSTAESKIAESVEELIVQLKRSLTHNEDPDFHFRCWLAAVIEQDETGQSALQRIDTARAEIVTAIAETQNTDVLPLNPTSK